MFVRLPMRTSQYQNKIRSGRYRRRPRPRRVSHTYTHFSREGGGRRTWMLILAAASIPCCCYYTGPGSAACFSVCLCVFLHRTHPLLSPSLLLFLSNLAAGPHYSSSYSSSSILLPPLASHLPLLRLPCTDVLTLDKQNQTPSCLVSTLPMCLPPPCLH